MGRPKRAAAGGWIYHVLNRANARTPIFSSSDDFEAFEQVLEEAVARTKIRLLSYCVMGNHWHLVVWPEEDGQLSKFVGWLTLTHTQRWHAQRQSRPGALISRALQILSDPERPSFSDGLPVR